MENLVQRKIKKDFSARTLSNVFVKRIEKTERIEFTLNSSNKKLCVVLENALSDKLVKLINDVVKETRVYILTKQIDPERFSLLKNKCIIRKSDSAFGNYAILDEREIVFFNSELDCIVVKNDEAVKKLREFFIYNFWNRSTEEFISEQTNVGEKTFDVTFPQENNFCLFDKTADEKSKLKELFEKADTYWLRDSFAGDLKKKNKATFYLSEKCVKSEIDFLKQSSESQKIYFSKDVIHSAFVSGGKNFIADFENAANLDNKGNAFAVECPEPLPNLESYEFTKSITFQAAEQEILLDESLKPLKVEKEAEEKNPVRLLLDKKDFRDIRKYSDEQLREFLDKRKELESKSFACIISFQVVLQLRGKSIQEKASIYREYEKFTSEYKRVVLDKKKELISQKGEYEKKLQRMQKETDAAVSSKEKISDVAKKLSIQIKDCEDKIQKLNDSKLEDGLDTVKSCVDVKKFCSENEIKLPAELPKYDKPKFGILFEQNGKYEYQVDDKDLDNAIEEMSSLKISNVSFV